MRFLWIEDNENWAHLQKEFFASTGLFSQEHQIERPDTLKKCRKCIGRAERDYDYVVLDINLENFDMDPHGKKLQQEFAIASKKEFLEEAGFHLYLDLLRQGFPTDRIIFLTGNATDNQVNSLFRRFQNAYKNRDSRQMQMILDKAGDIIKEEEYNTLADKLEKQEMDAALLYWKQLSDTYKGNAKNTYDHFENHFRAARLPVAFSISKNNKDDFHSWLHDQLSANNTDYGYLQLRRAVMDACIFWKQALNEKKFLILFNKTLEKGGFEKHDWDILFTRLQQLLPLQAPAKNQQNIYFRFLGELSTIWESSRGRFVKALEVDEEIALFQEFCQRQMKLLRNWTAHHQISNHLQAHDVAFSFLLACRAIFDVPIKEVLAYEHLLFDVFQQSETDTLSPKKIAQKLADSYYALRNDPLFNTNPTRNDFANLLSDLGRRIEKARGNDKEPIQQESLKLFYQNFWHSLHPLNLKMKAPDGRKSVAFFVDFPNFHWTEKEPFLWRLACCTFSLAFPGKG